MPQPFQGGKVLTSLRVPCYDAGMDKLTFAEFADRYCAALDKVEKLDGRILSLQKSNEKLIQKINAMELDYKDAASWSPENKATLDATFNQVSEKLDAGVKKQGDLESQRGAANQEAATRISDWLKMGMAQDAHLSLPIRSTTIVVTREFPEGNIGDAH